MKKVIYTCQHVEGNPAEGIPIQPACKRCVDPLRVLLAHERPAVEMRSAKIRGNHYPTNVTVKTPRLLREFMILNNAERRRASTTRYGDKTYCVADFYMYTV